jgi:hypothetical protein
MTSARSAQASRFSQLSHCKNNNNNFNQKDEEEPKNVKDQYTAVQTAENDILEIVFTEENTNTRKK